MKSANHTGMTLGRVSILLTASVAAVLLQSGVIMAADSPRERISIDNDWRFTKGDPEGITDNLRYPRTGRGGRGAAADSSQPSPTSGIAAYILPTGNAFIADATKKYTRPEGNYGGGVPFVSATFDDASWRQLDLPHDFGIEGPFNPSGDGGTGKLPYFGAAWYRKHLSLPASDAGKQIFLDMDGSMSYTTVWCNGQIVGGWPYGYSSWRVDLTPYVKPGGDNVLAIRLDNPASSSRWYPGGGIYRNVWLTKTSPVHVGQWGTFVTTPEVSAARGQVNLKVTIDNNAKKAAAVRVTTEIFALDSEGKKTGTVVATLPAADAAIAAGESTTVETKGEVLNPKLWSPDAPNRYVAVTSVQQDGAVVDTYETPFGIRTIKYDPNEGLFINGKHYKLNGTCNHHDLGALGTAVNVRALQRQLQMLRDMGCNALRTSHNPPAPELLEFADQMGFMVLDEMFDTWGQTKTPNDYGGGNLFNMWHEQDARALIRRDRNHPSVVMWSIGNEISEQNQGANSANGKALSAIAHSEDPTRYISAACNDGNAMNNGFNTLLDAMGFNYKPDNYIPFHRNFPQQFFFSTESSSTISTRGEYFFPVIPPGFGAISNGPPRGGRGRGPATASAPATGTAPATAATGRGFGGRGRGPVDTVDFNSRDDATRQMSSYDLYYPSWASSPDHEFFGQDHSAACAGEFVWTGWDYIGEPTPFGASRSSYFGIIDLAGFPKDRYYLYQAHWRPELPMAHILPHWNWPERVGQVTPVHVYTSGDEAELFLNGKSLGRKKKIFEGVNGGNGQPQVVNGITINGQPAYRIRWDEVVYEPGELKVVAYKDGKQWATDTVKTTGAAAQLQLKPDRATITGDGHDLSFVTLTVQDKDGLMVPRSRNQITFEISGPGEIVATDNGDPTDMNIFSKPERKAFNGLALAIVKAKRGQAGMITVTAKSEGLTTASTTISLK
jgi:beta-galactosidase